MDMEARGHSEHPQALRLWLRMLTLTQLIKKQEHAQLREHWGTTLPRFDLMAQLERNPDGLKMNKLSRRMMVTGGNVTGITDQLVAEGLVERVDVEGDRRAFRIRSRRAAVCCLATWRASMKPGSSRLFKVCRLLRPKPCTNCWTRPNSSTSTTCTMTTPRWKSHEALHWPGQSHAGAVRCAGRVPGAEFRLCV